MKNEILTDWLDQITVELTPIEVNKAENLVDLIPVLNEDHVIKIYLVHFPDQGFAGNFRAIDKMLENRRCLPVPHLAARNIADKKELEDILSNLERRGLKEVLLLGGGLPEQKGELETVMDMLETGLFEKYNIKNFGFAAHPEKHPFASDEDIKLSYQQKFDYVNKNKCQAYFMTQFSFEVEGMVELLTHLKKNEINLPVRVGIVGKVGFAKLIKYAIMCGVGNSINVLKKEAKNLSMLAKGYAPGEFLKELSNSYQSSLEGDKVLENLEGIHLFPFGNFKNTYDYFKLLKKGLS